jgi:hypothetical protein
MNESQGEVASNLVDLSKVTLAALDSCDDIMLAPVLAPLLRQIDTPTSSAGGHNS